MSNIDAELQRDLATNSEIFNLGKRKTHGAETVSTEQFYKYFKQQNAASLSNILEKEANMETHRNERAEGTTNYPITDEEFEAAINKLKANKSPGIDNVLNEVKKIGKEAIKGH